MANKEGLSAMLEATALRLWKSHEDMATWKDWKYSWHCVEVLLQCTIMMSAGCSRIDDLCKWTCVSSHLDVAG